MVVEKPLAKGATREFDPRRNGSPSTESGWPRDVGSTPDSVVWERDPSRREGPFEGIHGPIVPMRLIGQSVEVV
jgi:hypothetical protein